MKNHKANKTREIMKWIKRHGFTVNETLLRRVELYEFESGTTVDYTDGCIKLRTETAVKGVYNVLLLYSDGGSAWTFEFD